jgi:hypothetical protein
LVGFGRREIECMPFERIAAAVAAAVLGIAGLGAGSNAAAAEKRVFTIAAVEPQGNTTADKEPFPIEPLPVGGGYVLKPPDQSGRWGVEVYVWQPSQILVNQGDEVTLEFVGINGQSHPVTVSGFGKTFTLKRGHVQRVTFVADKAGIFRFYCSAHMPSMTGELVVMAKN